VINVLSKFGVCERASIDEAYLDVTAAAQQLLTDAKRGAVTTGNHSSDSGAAPVAAQGPGEPGYEQQNEHSEQLADPEGLAVPLPDSFEGWHVAGVVSTRVAAASGAANVLWSCGHADAAAVVSALVSAAVVGVFVLTQTYTRARTAQISLSVHAASQTTLPLSLNL
jgi:hypothetical protein